MTAPPLIRDIAKHPVLSKVHLIAEPWDLGMYQVRVILAGCRVPGMCEPGHVPGESTSSRVQGGGCMASRDLRMYQEHAERRQGSLC